MTSSTLRQLSVFKAVVDTGSFSAAAAVLSISQPSVSEHIRALETHFRQLLLDRKRGRAPVVTDAGRKIYEYAGTVLDQSERISADLDATRAGRDRVLSFAAHMFIADKLLPPVLADFAKRWPKVEMIAHVGRSDAVAKLVRDGDVDLGFLLAREGERNEDLQVETLGRQSLVIIAAPDHPLANQRRVSLDRVAEYPFMMPEKGTEYDRRVTSMLANIGLANVKTSIQTPHMRMWYGLVASTNSLCVAIRNRVTPELARGELGVIDIDMDPLYFEVQAVWRDEMRISDAARKFLTALRRLKDTGVFVG